MLFKKYHIVIFKDREGSFRHLRLPAWIGIFLLLLLAGLTAAVIYLWEFYPRSLNLQHQLEEAQKTAQVQSAQIISMAGTLHELQQDLRRIQQFDAKLRIMMNVDKESTAVADNRDEPQDNSQGMILLPLHRQDLLARRMHSLAEQIGDDIYTEEVQQQDLLLALRENRELMSVTPSIWPTEGHLSSRFGYRTNPVTGKSQLHAGLDIANRPGTPIIAPGKGVVTFAAWDGAYGNSVVINHGNNTATRYAHMQKFVVKEGQTVNRGDLIGYVGSTGRSTGPHLHYEVRIGGVPVDPMRYILN